MLRRTNILLALMVSLIVFAACSDRQYGELYCPAGPRDTMLVYPELDFRQVEVLPYTIGSVDQDPGMAGMESLFLGSDGKTASSILANYDFSQRDMGQFPTGCSPWKTSSP